VTAKEIALIWIPLLVALAVVVALATQ